MSVNPKIKNGVLSATLYGVDILRAILYNGQYKSLANSYAHDILLPASGFFFCKAFNMFKGNKYAIGAYEFLGCSAFEIAQGLGLWHGTYDPKDFIAYAGGVGLALTIDMLISRENQKSLEEKLV